MLTRARVIIASLAAFCAIASADDPILSIDTGGHTAPVRSVVFTPDSQFLVSAGDDKVVRVWSVATGETVRSLRGQIGPGINGAIYAAALSPDGRMLAVAGRLPADGIRLHNLATGEVIGLLKGHSSTVECVAFSPDGRRLASADAGGTVRMWDTGRMGPVGSPYQGHKNRVHTIAFSPDGSRLVSGGYDKTVRLWDTGSGTQIAQMTGHADVIVSVAFSRDGRTIASISNDGQIRLWDTARGASIGQIDVGGGRPANLSFTPDGTGLLATSASDAGISAKVYAPATRTVKAAFTGNDGAITATAISPNGRVAATAGGSGNEIYLWDPSNGRPLRKLAGKGQQVRFVAFANDGRSILFGRDGLDTRFWLNPQDDDFRVRLGGDAQPDGSEVSASRANGQLTLAVAAGPSGDAAASLRVNRGSKVVKEYVRNSSNGYRHVSFTFTPDGRVISGGLNGFLLLYTDRNPNPLPFIGHTGTVTAVAVSPDGRTLLSGSSDQTVKLWDIESRRNLLTVFVGTDKEWVAWTPEGYFASSFNGERYIGWHFNQGEQKEAKYWDVGRFRKAFDRPDIIAQELKLRDINSAVRVANQNIGRREQAPAAPSDVARIAPPDIRFLAPDEEGAQVDNENYTLKALAFSTTLPIREVSVLVNGERVGAPVSANGQSQDVSLPVRLSRGENILSVKAVNSQGIYAMQSRKVLCACKPKETVKKPNLIFLGIGISKYKAREISLQFADRDAEQVRDTFMKQKGGRLFGDIQAQLLTNENATREAIIKSLDWFKKAGSPGDVRVLFVAGHGELSPRNEYYLCASGHTPSDSPELNDVRGSILLDALTELPGKAVLMIDTCHSGAAGTRGVVAPDVDSILSDFKGVSGVAVFAAATRSESSIESDEWKHGAFTKAILDALSGQVKGEDGVIKTSHLATWLSDRVPAMTNKRQHPVVYHLPQDQLTPFPIFAIAR